MNHFKTGWYLIYTRPRHERRVCRRLSEMGIGLYLPVRKILKTWCDRKQLIEEPLFPSYIFIYLENIQNYYESLGIDGVCQYVRFGNEIASVSETVINNIRLILEKGGDIEISTGHIQPGQHLLIRKGPLSGLSCEVIEFRGDRKILVRVSLLQRNLIISLRAEYLMYLHNHPDV